MKAKNTIGKIYVSQCLFRTLFHFSNTTFIQKIRNKTIKVLLVIYLFSQTKYSYIKIFNIFYYPPR